MGFLIGASQVSAHVITIGYTTGVNAGEVNLWLGSYHYIGIGDGPNIEGSARLFNGGYDTTTPFNYSEGTVYPSGVPAPPPAGLVPGTNLFVSQSYAGGDYAATLSDVYSWEAVTISGLSAGTYTFQYVPAANPSAHWAPWPDLQNIQLTLTAGDTGGGGTNPGAVPEPASLAIWGSIGLMGFVAARRRKRLV